MADLKSLKVVDESGKSATYTIPEATDGKTPVKGVDYWTESDKNEIKSYVDNAILGGSW